MKSMILSVLGQGGLGEKDSEKSKKAFSLFTKLRLLILAGLILQWYLELHDLLGIEQSKTINLITWLYFVFELLSMMYFSRQKKEYLNHNWVSLLICLFGVLLLFFPEALSQYFKDGARLLLVIWLMIPWVDICFDSLSDNKLSTSIVTTMSIVVLSGVIISGLDPNIETIIDGIWWAWATITTVGYGDIVPTSIVGRAFGFVLILVGTILFSALTANFSAIFTKRKLKKGLISTKDDAEIKRIVKEIKDQLDTNSDLSISIKKIEARLKNIEKKLED